MKEKLHYVLFTMLILSICLSAQSKEQNAECNEKCRIKLNEQIVDEAKKLNLKLNLRRLVITSNPTALTAFVPIDGLENTTEDKLRENSVVGLYFINSKSSKSGLNGIYRLQLTTYQKKVTGENLTTIKLELLNSNGKSVKEIVLTKFEIPVGTAFIKPKDCWVGGTHGVCFPAKTTLWQIRFWELMCEFGCMEIDP